MPLGFDCLLAGINNTGNKNSLPPLLTLPARRKNLSPVTSTIAVGYKEMPSILAYQ
jgi:hypothetical protein